MLLVLVCFTFFAFFQVFTRKKARYISVMSERVKKIEKEGFGKTIEVIGDDELAELCKSINHMSIELAKKEKTEKENEKKRKELITNVSHDLRSPLTSIIGYVDLLKQENIKRDQYMQYIEVIDKRLQGLNMLIGELFELSKLEDSDQKLRFEKVDMNSFLVHMTQEYDLIFHEKGIVLKTDILSEQVFLDIDLEKITRALRNLLDNAEKYSYDKTILFRVWKNNSENVLCICVSNSIEEKKESEIELDSIFDRFYKGDIARSNTNSSGLGLAITKRIVELHGGNICAEIDDTEEKNKIFSIVIKLKM